MGSPEKQGFYLLRKVNMPLRSQDLVNWRDRTDVAVSGWKATSQILGGSTSILDPPESSMTSSLVNR